MTFLQDPAVVRVVEPQSSKKPMMEVTLDTSQYRPDELSINVEEQGESNLVLVVEGRHLTEEGKTEAAAKWRWVTSRLKWWRGGRYGVSRGSRTSSWWWSGATSRRRAKTRPPPNGGHSFFPNLRYCRVKKKKFFFGGGVNARQILATRWLLFLQHYKFF
jgi:hypothetical protein